LFFYSYGYATGDNPVTQYFLENYQVVPIAKNKKKIWKWVLWIVVILVVLYLIYLGFSDAGIPTPPGLPN